MAAPTLVFWFIGTVFTAIFYGLYCMIFGLYWRIQLKRADRRTRNGVFFYALNVNFILCTAYFIICIILVQFHITKSVLNDNSLKFAMDWMTAAICVLYIFIDSISQLVLLYRCWIMWRQPLVMVIPCILSLTFLVIALTIIGFDIKILSMHNLNLTLPDWWNSAATAFFFISLGANALVTAMIVYKIITVYHDIRRLGFGTSYVETSVHGDGHRDLYPLIWILIESGLITSVGQLAQSIIFKLAGEAIFLGGGCVLMLYGISMTVVVMRVETGVTYDHYTSRTVDSTNSGRPIQLTPIALKTVRVERSDSSE